MVKDDYLILLLVTLHFALSEKHSGINNFTEDSKPLQCEKKLAT
jgi:hypothetical protein